MTDVEVWQRALPWIFGAFGGVTGLWAAVKGVFAFWSWLSGLDARITENARRLDALWKRADEINETIHGEHGFYARFAGYDIELKHWAKWRHEVMEKELNRIALEVGGHDDDFEDIRAELALCERRK